MRGEVQRAVEYNEKKGNCNVPQSLGALSTWVITQCTAYRNGKLSQERTSKLKGVRFNWAQEKKSDTEQWEEMFNKLVECKEKNDNYNVPRSLVHLECG